MKDEDYRSVYLDLSDTYLKFLFARLIIMTTIFINLYEGTNSKKYEELVGYYNTIADLSSQSQGIPLYNNWFIDGMFELHGIYSSDSLRALQHAYYVQDTRFNSKVSTIDTALVSKARNQQVLLLDSINRKLPEIFLLKIDFISTQAINIQYWIFLLPFFYIISCIYGYTLKRKMNITVFRSKISGRVNDITDFERFPATYLISFMSLCHLIVLIGSIMTFYKIVNDFRGYQKIILYSSFLIAFFSMVFTNQVIIDMEKRFVDKLIAVKIWKRFRHGTKVVIDSIDVRVLVGVCSLLLVLVLFVCVVSNFDLISNSSERPFLLFRGNKWHVIKTIKLTRSELDKIFLAHNSILINGYRINFNSLYQVMAAMSILITVLLVFRFFLKIFLNRDFSRNFIKLIFNILVIVYIFTITFYGLPVRSFYCAIFAIVTISWLYYKNDKFFKYNQIKVSKAARNTLLFTLPFLVMYAFYSTRDLLAFIANLVSYYPDLDEMFLSIYWNTVAIGVLFPLYIISLLIYSYKLYNRNL